MEKQRIFTNRYASELRRNVEEKSDVSCYHMKEFPYDDTQVLVMQNRNKPEGLLERMLNANSDCEAAKELYLAYSDLSPLEAAYTPFWDYLSHIDLYQVVCKRWPEVFNETAGNPSTYILEHWFGKDIMQCLSGWWWTVNMTVGDDGGFSLTDFIFDRREDLRQNLGVSTLFRHKPFTRAVLAFLRDTPEITSEAQIPRSRFIIQHFNRLGAIKQLTYMDEEYFRKALIELKSSIMAVKSLQDLK